MFIALLEVNDKCMSYLQKEIEEKMRQRNYFSNKYAVT